MVVGLDVGQALSGLCHGLGVDVHWQRELWLVQGDAAHVPGLGVDWMRWWLVSTQVPLGGRKGIPGYDIPTPHLPRDLDLAAAEPVLPPLDDLEALHLLLSCTCYRSVCPASGKTDFKNST